MKKPKTAHEFVVLIGFDAMRICLGARPKHFTKSEVVRWMTKQSALKSKQNP